MLQSEYVDLQEYKDGSYWYMVSGVGVNGKIKTSIAVEPKDMIHIKYLTSDAITGIDIIGTHKENLGINIAATKFSAAFYGNGANVSSVLESDDELTIEGAERLRNQFNQKHAGVENSFGTAVLESGVKYKKVGLSPEEANLNSTKKHQIEEVGRIVGIPAHMLSSMDKATFNNIEIMSLDFVKILCGLC